MTKNSANHSKEEVLREFRVRELLDAACRVVARHGFQGATVDRVAEEAKIAKGTVYLYFHNKDELLKAAIEQGIENFTSQIRAEVAQVKAPLDKVRRFVEASLELSDAHRDFFKTLLLERNFLAASPNHPEAAQMLDLYLAHIHFIEQIIQEGVHDGVFRSHNTEAAAFALNEAIRGCFQQRALGLTARPAAEDADILLDIFFYGILNHSDRHVTHLSHNPHEEQLS
ncbi:MAG TPA: TetR/AcrR family transcriptional regulator [Candidatus Binatia bacterium]|jgi:AcrR family transcriptional regulator|nr:TetR/AcrR family transcriptional regulator [Candidatus Binatia bacterium]